MKKFIGFLIIIVIAAVFIYQFFLKEAEPEFTLATVARGNVVQEVSETGQVKKGDKIELSFKSGGVIEEIYVETGGEVKTGDVLAKLEKDQLNIQLTEAQANLELYQAQLSKLLTGATPEEVQISQTAVNNTRVALDVASQALEDIKAQGQDNLKAACEDALNVLDDSYLKISNAKNAADLIQTTYFYTNDQASVRVRENEDKIQSALNQVTPYLNTAKSTEADEDIDAALLEMKVALEATAGALKIIRETCEEINYRNVVSSTNKSTLDTHRGYINTALTNAVNSQQTISSTKLTNTVNINTYQGQVDSAQGTLKAAQDELAQLIAPPREEDVDLYQAQVKQARASVQLLEKQMADTILKSPVAGQVIEIGKRAGEMVQSALKDVVLSILPKVPFKIEVDIYEEDVVKMKVGNPVDIFLVAYPENHQKGKIAFIDPSEKIIDDVVYYKTTSTFDSLSVDVKPGMTADLVIKTDSRENVLIIPEDAIEKENGKNIVQLFAEGKPKKQEIETGLYGVGDMVEVLSGLGEGEIIIIP